jgi:hypothetical protein
MLVFMASWAVGCGIPDDDLLPGMGAPCAVADGLCPIEHVCRPNAPGEDRGVCEPVLSYGACDKPTHLPGRFGKVDDGDVVIDEPADKNKLDDIRRVDGEVRLHRRADELEIGDLCFSRTLQRVGDAVYVGNTDVETLDGLQSLTTVHTGISIFGNANLNSLDGLAQVRDIGGCGDLGDVLIANNRDLSPGTISAFTDALSKRLGREATVLHCGNGRIGDQDGTCAAQQAVIDLLQNGDDPCSGPQS